MKQADLPLFDRLTGQGHQAYRNSDPETSRMAARDSASFVSGQRKEIYEVLKASQVPLAAEQIADAMGLESHVPVNRRLPEIVDAGLIEPVDRLHKNRSGSMARRFRVRA